MFRTLSQAGISVDIHFRTSVIIYRGAAQVPDFSFPRHKHVFEGMAICYGGDLGSLRLVVDACIFFVS